MATMNDRASNRAVTRYERTMRAIAVAVLAIGLVVAAAILIMAPPDAPAADGPYVANVDNSKKVQLELQRIGGKAAVVAAEFTEWFDGMWHGRRLAATVAVLAVGVSMLCFLAAKLPPLDD
jgi:hypothetical protein